MLLAVHRLSYKLQLNIINTLLQVQTMHYGKPSIDDDERRFDGDISTRHGKRADGKTTAKLRRFLRDLIPGH